MPSRGGLIRVCCRNTGGRSHWARPGSAFLISHVHLVLTRTPRRGTRCCAMQRCGRSRGVRRGS
eukprot:1572567-Lingulodinium_polyedra.AAC.1